tara:strand:- start:710 stop:1303 length:594 start_codon:yes stop_codon:yes gene_type:complete
LEPEPNVIELEPELRAELPDDLDIEVIQAIVADLDEEELDEFEDALVAIIADADAEFVEDVSIVLEAIIDTDPGEELNEDEIEALVETFEDVVESDSFEELDLGQIGALGEQINDAPDEVKVVFEEAVEDDLFSGALDDYITTESEITQGERRTVIAVTAASTAALALPRPAAPTTSASGPSGPSGSGGPTRRRNRR